MEIKDRVARGDNKYIIRDLDDGTGRKELIPFPDEVIEPGTPVNKALLQPLFNGLDKLDEVGQLVDQGKQQIQQATDTSVARIEAAQPIQLANDLITTVPGKGLDAAQGAILKEMIDNIPKTPINNTLTSDSETEAISAKQGKILKGLVDAANQKASEAFQSASSGKTEIAAAITGKGVAASSADTFPTLANKITQIRQGRGNAQPADVLIGQTFSNDQGDQRGTMPNLGNWSLGMSASGSVTIPRGFHRGGGQVTAQMVSGRTIMPGTSQQTAIGAGQMARGDIVVAGDGNLNAGNIRDGASVFGVRGTYGREEKALIANAITGKGIPTSTTASWQTMAENINLLSGMELREINTGGVGRYEAYVPLSTKAVIFVWSEITEVDMPRDYVVCGGFMIAGLENKKVQEITSKASYVIHYGVELQTGFRREDSDIKVYVSTFTWSRNSYQGISYGILQNQKIKMYIIK